MNPGIGLTRKGEECVAVHVANPAGEDHHTHNCRPSIDDGVCRDYNLAGQVIRGCGRRWVPAGYGWTPA